MPGWIGTMGQLKYALDTFGADRDPDGRIKIWGKGVFSLLGMGGDDAEVVVPAECECEINGQRCSVAGLLGQTSYGLRVTVIG